VRLYEGCGFRRVRRLLGHAGSGGAAEPASCVGEPVDLRAMARAVSANDDGTLPWQVSAETLAQFAPPWCAYRLGSAFVAISNPAAPTISVRGLVHGAGDDGRAEAASLLRSLMVSFPGKEWKASAIFPEELAPVFAAAGMQRTELSQWQMALELS
jgi:hypothetical protein